jgi:hypothetical protein
VWPLQPVFTYSVAFLTAFVTYSVASQLSPAFITYKVASLKVFCTYSVASPVFITDSVASLTVLFYLQCGLSDGLVLLLNGHLVGHTLRLSRFHL